MDDGRVHLVRMLHRIGESYRGSGDINEALRTTAAELTQELGLDQCVILMRDSPPIGDLPPWSEAITQWLGTLGEPLVVADVAEEGRFTPLQRQALTTAGVGALLFIPLVNQGEAFGGVGCLHKKAPHRWDANERYFVKAIARQLSVVMVSRRMHQAMMEQQEQLRLSQQRLTSLLEIAPDAIISVDQDMRVVLFNQAAEMTFGYRTDEIMGQPLETLVPQRLRERHQEQIARYLSRPPRSAVALSSRQMVGRRRSGEEFPCEVSISMLEMGAQLFYTAIVRDATERKRVEEALIAEHAEVSSLTTVASLIADGDLGVRATARASGELCELARALNHMAEQLQARIREREQSRRRIIEMEEDLRRKVAEKLHGPVQSKLVTLWWRLGQCEELLNQPDTAAQVAAIISEVRVQLDRVNEVEIRGLSHQLHPSIVQLGLGPALLALREQFDGLLAVSVQIDPNLLHRDDPMGTVCERVVLTVYRVVEEALINVVKHAQARTVRITAVGLPGRLEVTVQDDGVGFSTGRARAGLGITLMQDYVDTLDGTLRIDCLPGQGTTVVLSLPT